MEEHEREDCAQLWQQPAGGASRQPSTGRSWSTHRVGIGRHLAVVVHVHRPALLPPQRLLPHVLDQAVVDDGVGLKPRDQEAPHGRRVVLQGLWV